MDINTEMRILIDSRILRNTNEIHRFENVIAKILNMNEVDHIKNLCSGFDDSTEHHEVMFGLIHAIESYYKTFGPEEVLQRLAESINTMLPHAREWAKILHKRILNHDLFRRAYAEIVSNIDIEIKDEVLQLIIEIKGKNPKKFETSASEFLSSVR